MSKNYSNMLNRLLDGNSLSEEESYKLMIAMANETISPILSGALLAGLRAKGEIAVASLHIGAVLIRSVTN